MFQGKLFTILVALKKGKCSKAALLPQFLGSTLLLMVVMPLGDTANIAAFHPRSRGSSVCILHGSTIVLTGRKVERGSS